MTTAQARMFVTALAAAFPFPRVPDSTVALYIEQIAQLQDVDAAREAIRTLIANEDRFPTIALIGREYRPHAKRNADERARERGLNEPPPDPDIARRARELRDRLSTIVAERATRAGLGE